MAETMSFAETIARTPSRRAGRRVWRDGAFTDGDRDIAEETPVALVYNASTEAVMMATPADLEDFAVGFSLTEGLIATPADIRRLDIVSGEHGIEARMWLKTEVAEVLSTRRRLRTGPTGCGLCGVESLEEAVRRPPPLTSNRQIAGADVIDAVARLSAAQSLGAQTRATHAAAFWCPESAAFLIREDVGRHNGLDKLAGALARHAIKGHNGVVILSSRVSVEMVQKTVAIGAPILIAVSAPTALAVRVAEAANLTLIAVARSDGFEVFTHSRRLTL
ncbi:formate dehydrogenase accessory sulfurtransferase FdhD [Asticcacaulis sp. YBE204]|uniref:formate dehydrogenase accessory sulfurtransferase FdhD n=1 Tax=Asticcacaulis sp. YBE204 TaxID=1282363 RepID=UPI0003C3FB1F|nr:formate dehydrogenase accessory sulfurtransferase FdhD [Asticcacaulis sp. YBE204]ESQ78718.1 hypothetical protein AEYBE204_12090 [Asticcacaulis sp. YBE204]